MLLYCVQGGSHSGPWAPLGVWQGMAPPQKRLPLGFPAALTIQRGLVALTLASEVVC